MPSSWGLFLFRLRGVPTAKQREARKLTSFARGSPQGAWSPNQARGACRGPDRWADVPTRCGILCVALCGAVSRLVQDGQIVLLGRHTVCKEGKPLTVEQAQLLVRDAWETPYALFLPVDLLCPRRLSSMAAHPQKHLDIKMGEFEVKVVGAQENGKYRRVR